MTKRGRPGVLCFLRSVEGLRCLPRVFPRSLFLHAGVCGSYLVRALSRLSMALEISGTHGGEGGTSRGGDLDPSTPLASNKRLLGCANNIPRRVSLAWIAALP